MDNFTIYFQVKAEGKAFSGVAGIWATRSRIWQEVENWRNYKFVNPEQVTVTKVVCDSTGETIKPL